MFAFLAENVFFGAVLALVLFVYLLLILRRRSKNLFLHESMRGKQEG